MGNGVHRNAVANLGLINVDTRSLIPSYTEGSLSRRTSDITQDAGLAILLPTSRRSNESRHTSSSPQLESAIAQKQDGVSELSNAVNALRTNGGRSINS